MTPWKQLTPAVTDKPSFKVNCYEGRVLVWITESGILGSPGHLALLKSSILCSLNNSCGNIVSEWALALSIRKRCRDLATCAVLGICCSNLLFLSLTKSISASDHPTRLFSLARSFRQQNPLLIRRTEAILSPWDLVSILLRVLTTFCSVY